MALSNTATPKYYGQFRDAVLRGEIPVNQEISMEMNRTDALIANPNYWYDDQAVEGWIKFCESELTLTNGEPVHMLDTFKLWAESVYGWYEFVERDVYKPYKHRPGGRYVRKVIKKRLRTRQYLIVGRGAAKSMYGSFIHNFELNVNGLTTNQIATAPTMRQADEVMSPIRTAMNRTPGPLLQFLTLGSLQNTTGAKANRPKLMSTKEGIINTINGSKLSVLPMSIDKVQGTRINVATIDEWLSGDTREDVIGAIDQSCSKEQGSAENNDYLIIAMSSEGTVRNGPGDSIKMELMKILKGEYENDHVSIWWYKLDSVDEVGMPEMWLKAQPNLGITVTYETYHLDVERAEKAPATRNDILAKRFGLPMEGYTYFFTYEETMPVDNPLDFRGMACSMGADLSQGDDFCSFSFLFPLSGGAFGVKTRNYISERTLHKLPLAMRQKYDEFRAEGSLVVMPGTTLKIPEIYEDLEAHILEQEYDVRCFGYDPYFASAFIERWESENGPYGIVTVKQGAKTESVPLGEIKKLTEDQLLLFDEKIMQYTMGNCIVLEDTNGNRKLFKKRYDHKIDSVAATMDAYVAWGLNTDEFE